MSTTTTTDETPTIPSFPIPEATIAQVFSRLDKNKDGVLSIGELSQIFEHVRIPPPSPRQMRALFDQMDNNHNGKIELQELHSFVVHRQQQLRDIFEFICESCEQQKQQQRAGGYSSSSTATQPTVADDVAISTAEGGGIPRCQFDARAFRSAAKIAGVDVTQADCDRAMSLLDLNLDEVVNFAEFCEALLLVPAVNVRFVFERFMHDAFFESDASFFGFHVSDSPSHRHTVSALRKVNETFRREGRDADSGDDDREQLQPFDLINIDDEREFLRWLDRKTAIVKQWDASEELRHSLMTPAAERVAEAEHAALALQREHEKTMRAVWKKLSCGGLAGIIARTLTAPLDLVRIKLMVDSSLTMQQAFLQASCTRSGGVLGLWRGNLVNCGKAFPELGLKLTVFDMALSRYARDPHHVEVHERLIAGGIAGAASQVAVYPFDVARTRMIACPRGQFTSISQTIRHIVAHEGGINRLFAGITPSLIGIAPYAAIDLAVNSQMKEMFIKHFEKQQQQVGNNKSSNNKQTEPLHDSAVVPVWALLSCGMVSSAVAMTLTFPINVVRTVAQATGSCSAKVTKGIWRKDGIKGFFRGFGITAVKVLPATSISYGAYDRLGSWFDQRFSAV